MDARSIRTIRQAVDRMADTVGDEIFLVSPEAGRNLTYAEFRGRCRAIEAALRGAGLQPGDKVALLLDNGLFTVQAFLGTIYAGLVAAPLNVRAGPAQLASTMSHCDARALYVEEQYAELARGALADVARDVLVIPAHVDALAERYPPASAAFDPFEPDAEDPALLMYSSGTVGQPKAAVHSHRTLLAHGENSVLAHALTRADRSLLVLPIYHINAECVTLIPTLLSGGSVVVPRQFSIAQFWSWLDEHECTWSAVVPTIVAQLLDRDELPAARHRAIKARLRFLRSSSAPLSSAMQRAFMDRFGLPLIQAMGSTEGGNIFSNPQPPGENKMGSPGLAWGFETRIVDGSGADVPTGEPGEVLLRGPAVMQGYYKDPDMTAAALDVEGWLHTGDLACQDTDGYFFVVGRAKEVIIKAGVNIAPRQIDEALESHPAVLEAATVGVPDTYLGEDLVAFVVLREGLVGDERAILTFCEDLLDPFKTPTRLHFVADLPKGPSGKVQRLHLVDRAVALGQAVPRYAEAAAPSPTSAAEGPAFVATIAAAWDAILNCGPIEPSADFFALGGQSLMAIKCLSKLRETLPVTLSLSDFFENPTLGQQAALVERRLNDAAQPAESQCAAPPVTTYPLSTGQRRILYVGKLAPDVPLYNETDAVRLRGTLDIGALQRTLDTLVARHDTLRTTIHDAEDGPLARVHESWPFTLRQIDLSGLAETARAAELARLLVDEPRRVYDLAAEPGFRMTLLRLGPADHVLILMMHHVVTDGWSWGVFWRELSACYAAFVAGGSPALPPLPAQYGDYATGQAERAAKADFSAALDHWEQRLRGAPALLELPTDRPRPNVQTFRGAKQRFAIEAELAARLRSWTRQERTSLFNLFATGLNVLLHRYSGGTDILIGLPVADRDRPETESLIGFLLDVQALRTEFSRDMAFREVLTRVQAALIDLYTHRAVPFEAVVDRLRPERNLSHAPLFQVLFIWRDRDLQLPFLGMQGLDCEPLLSETGTSKFDLTFVLTDWGDDIALEIEYSTDLFDDDRIARLFGHLRTLLENAVADPGRAIATLPILTPAERSQLLVEWNATKADYPEALCLHQLFELQVALTPGTTAVTYRNTSLTYAALNARCNQLAHRLRQLGVGPDTRVAICMERSVEMVQAIYAVLKAGGAYVPLDPDYPADRLAFMLGDSAPVLVLTHGAARGVLERGLAMPGRRPPVLDLEADSTSWADNSTANPDAAAIGLGPHHLAYVIYTSGSTGTPKGVMNEHGPLVSRMQWMQDTYRLSAEDTVLQKSPYSFDVSGLEFFWPLAWGARLAIAPPGAHRDPALLAKVINAERVTVTQFVPSMLRIFLDHPAARSCTSLKHVLCIGEALPLPVVTRFHEVLRDAELHNLYGPTEAAIHATAWACAGPLPRGATAPPIGRPIANARMYILDDNHQPVPVGVPGELHIGGVGVARGYLNRPQLTAERFIPNPFVAGERLYRTGDLARYLPDGDIDYIGRNDFQVKLRGYRIELGEIESQIASYPGIRETAVILCEDEPGDTRLAAYVAPHDPQQAIDFAKLRQHLGKLLPEYMVPGAFVALERLPLTTNGKLDRKALPRTTAEPVTDPAPLSAPRSLTEEVVAQIWSRLLKRTELGIHDNFFESGGTSLKSLQLIAEIRSAFDYELPLANLYASPTIAGIARAIQEQHADKPQLVQLKSGGPGSCTVIIQPDPLLFELVQKLQPKGRLLSTFAPWPETLGGEAPETYRIEELATPHAKLIDAQLGSSRCILLGFCFSGILALETARQLEQAGRKVEAIVLLDSPASKPSPWWFVLTPLSLRSMAGSLHRRLSRIWPLSLVLTGTAPLHPRIIYFPDRDENGDILGLRWWPMGIEPFLRRLRQRYDFAPVDCQGIYFRCLVEYSRSWRDQNVIDVWRQQFSRGFQAIDVPGHHLSMLKPPHVEDLADRINRALEQIIGRSSFDLESSPKAETIERRTAAFERAGRSRDRDLVRQDATT